MSNKLNLTDNEKRDIIKYLEKTNHLPEKYRFLLFEMTGRWSFYGMEKPTRSVNTVLPFQTIEHIDEPRSEGRMYYAISMFDLQEGRFRAGRISLFGAATNSLYLH